MKAVLLIKEAKKWGKGIKVENFNVELRFGHGALRSKHELELNVDRFCHGF